LKSLRPPKAAREFLEPLARRADGLGLTLYAVGGCVRDWLRGRRTYDLDLACSHDPKALAESCAVELGGKAEAFGQFGTYRVLAGGHFRVDFATARRESYPEPASLPVVARPAPIDEDLRRRDFTVNAMALALNGPRAGELLDPFGGRLDLEAGRLRLLHPLSLRDDPTRAFRAARYACRLKLAPDTELERQCRAAVRDGHAALLSPHRLTQELLRLLAEPEAAGPLHLLDRWGYHALFGAKLPAPAAGLRGVEERLCGMVLSLGAAGPGFVSKLALDRRLSGDLHELMKLMGEQRSARDEVPAHVKRALRLSRPALPAAALKPLFVTGQDLKAMGFAPGPAFKEVLDRLAALQWQGKLATRAAALKRARELIACKETKP
jgi:tRNA nucleotidyltransferase (CCA-adding enzyme)